MRVLLVGDTHGNAQWLERAVFSAARQHRADVIFQVGDFGWWPRNPASTAFLDVARGARVPLWWIDGNHEDHDSLRAAIAEAGGKTDAGLIELGSNLFFVPRGTRFDFGGVSVLACGGAHSIDRRLRTAGIDWFEDEHITDDDVLRCLAHGHVDVLISHDAPAGWQIPSLPPERGFPDLWQLELTECWAHRRQLTRIMEAVTPRLVVHGHYHSGYRHQLDTGWGQVEIVGLSEDGTTGNLVLLDCSSGTCATGQVVPPR
jgi:predicted phosphodiesterase